jgi:hypothetical protein
MSCFSRIFPAAPRKLPPAPCGHVTSPTELIDNFVHFAPVKCARHLTRNGQKKSHSNRCETPTVRDQIGTIASAEPKIKTGPPLGDPVLRTI